MVGRSARWRAVGVDAEEALALSKPWRGAGRPRESLGGGAARCWVPRDRTPSADGRRGVGCLAIERPRRWVARRWARGDRGRWVVGWRGVGRVAIERPRRWAARRWVPGDRAPWVVGWRDVGRVAIEGVGWLGGAALGAWRSRALGGWVARRWARGDRGRWVVGRRGVGSPCDRAPRPIFRRWRAISPALRAENRLRWVRLSTAGEL